MKRQLVGTAIATLLLLNVPLVFSVDATEQLPSWTRPRPTEYRLFEETVGNACSDNNIAVGLGVEIGEYFPRSEIVREDWVRLKFDVSATTRKGITYVSQQSLTGNSYCWVEVNETIGISGDDTGQWVELGFSFLYYGITYQRIWVCGNGFVSLNNESALGNPCPIPSPSVQSAMIAPFWTKLKPSLGNCSIKKGIQYWAGENNLRRCFVVTWENVSDTYGHRQTFQLLIEEREGFGADQFHNKIFFQYKNITKDGTISVGVQDRLGQNGYSFDLAQVCNSKCLGTHPGTSGSRLSMLNVTMTKTDTYAKVTPLTDMMAGRNVQINETEIVWNDFWAGVIKTGAKKLNEICKCVPVVGTLFVIYDIASATASANSKQARGPIGEANTWDNESWAQVDCFNMTGDQGFINYRPFDASFDDLVLWRFTDMQPLQNHTLTINATAYYEDYDLVQYRSVSTSVVLNMYTGSHYLDLDTYLIGAGQAAQSKVWVNGTQYTSPISTNLSEGNYAIECESPIYRNSAVYTFHAWIENDSEFSTCNHTIIHLDHDMSPKANYEFWGYRLTTSVATAGWGTVDPPGASNYPSGVNASATATANPGYVFSHWALNGGGMCFVNPISVIMNQNHNLTAYFTVYGGGGGGEPCPDLLVWNGSTYLPYGIINIHNSTGEDVVKEVSISKQDVGVANCTAKFMLVEGWVGLNFSESTVDKVKLYATDSYGNRYLCPLINATHSREGNVLLPLLFSDNWKTQIFLLERIDLTFLTPYPKWMVQGYTFVIEGCNRIKN